MKDSYPPSPWDPTPARWPPGGSNDAWNQSWGQDPYSVYTRGPSATSSYGSYGWQSFEPRRPLTLQIAVALMSVGAGLDGLGVILSLMSIADNGLSGGYGIVGAAIGTGLWTWMALANRAGKRSARTTATVFFGINTLGLGLLVLVIHQFSHIAARVGVSAQAITANTDTALLAGIGIWVLGLVTIVLLWTRASSDYYAAMTGTRY